MQRINDSLRLIVQGHMDYKKVIILKYLKSLTKKVKYNTKLQEIYDSSDSIEDVLFKLEQYNIEQPIFFLASGQSCYFNNQIDTCGLSSMKIDEETKSDAQFIAYCFGKRVNIGSNNLPILYTTLLGTTELNYAMQTFPAGIFEDVFQCSAGHNLPIQPIVGEREMDYFVRVLDYNISQFNEFPSEKREEVLFRAKRLITKFCFGKNRVYLLPFDNIINNKASFGDITGLRDGNEKNTDSILSSMPTFIELLEKFNISNSPQIIYNDPNITSEYGIAIYGNIDSNGVSFFEVERKYSLMQKKAIELGYFVGEEIPETILYMDSKKTKSL